MKRIYKYNFNVAYTNTVQIPMPRGAQILAAGCQDVQSPEDLSLWAIVEVDREKATGLVQRKVGVLGTGFLVPQDWPEKDLIHIDTIVIPSAVLVWHVFDLGEV